MELGLNGKRALVMGSSTGIGRAIAEGLINEGAKVAITSSNLDRISNTAKEIGAHAFFEADLTQSGAGAELVKSTIQKLGGIDILITNAGGPKKGVFGEISENQWKNDFQSLWLSVVEALNAALPSMKSQGYGRIAMITSIAAQEPLPGLTTSNGLRAGLSGLCKSVANEYAPFGITVNAILPGYTDTDRMKELNLPEEKIRQMVPAGRMATPKEVSDLTCFVVSDCAGYITGQSLLIDGGASKSY
ncbi:MAG: SDR family oxidoreductase [Bdellovibrionales bacterium]|nr:SDR family oxidoreductase [Bdellovibrionales bacterium]